MVSPVIVAGMHRSGTSLVASFLSSLGLDLGDDLIPADSANPRGYFEDRRFVELQRRILQECTPAERGLRDWGWTEGGGLDRARFAEYRDLARALIRQRDGRSGAWGWKDPRSALLLEFWDRLLDDASFVLLYRFPWEVADSMQRLGAEVFLRHPEYAYRIWSFYNRHILEFYQRHADRAVLASTNALIRRPRRFADLVQEKLGIELSQTPFDEIYEAEALATVEGEDPLIGLVAATSPDCVDLLRRLDGEADLPAAGLWRAPDEIFPLSAIEAKPAGGGEVAVSVVIPCRDHGQLLVEAVASVQRNAPRACELIIVDDGSREPRTLEVLAILEGAGFHVIHLPGAGLAAARNRGIEAARGRYVLPLDADNRLRPGALETAISLLDASPEVGVVYGDCEEFGLRSRRREVPEFDLDTLLAGNYIDACAVYRKEVWEQVGGYDPAMRVWEDWEFWIHAAKRGWRFQRIPDVTFDYRVRPGSLVTQAERSEVRERVIRHLLAKHWDLYQRGLQQPVGPIVGWPGVLGREEPELLVELVQKGQQLHRAREDGRRLLQERTRLVHERDDLLRDRDHLRQERDDLRGEQRRQGEIICILEEERSRCVHEIAVRDAELGALRASLERSQAETERLAEQVRARQAVLDRVHSSLGWRLLSFYRRWLDRLLPRAGRWRSVYERTLDGLRGSS